MRNDYKVSKLTIHGYPCLQQRIAPDVGEVALTILGEKGEIWPYSSDGLVLAYYIRNNDKERTETQGKFKAEELPTYVELIKAPYQASLQLRLYQNQLSLTT